MDKTELRQQRKLAALMHYNLVKEEFSAEIEKSIAGSDIFYAKETLPLGNEKESAETSKPKMYVYHSSEDILFKNPEICSNGRKVCILNFADSIHPGGGYFKGYTTQEEELCFNSTLLPVLEHFRGAFYEKNKQDFKKGGPFGLRNGIYSPDIVFFRDDETPRTADVITVAAPNIGYYLHNHNIGDNFSYFALEKMKTDAKNECEWRITMIFDQAKKHGVTDLVLGAWGCGAFGNDPEDIANIFEAKYKYYPEIQTHFVLVEGGKNKDIFWEKLQ